MARKKRLIKITKLLLVILAYLGISAGIYSAFSNTGAACCNLFIARNLDLSPRNTPGINGYLPIDPQTESDEIGPVFINLQNGSGKDTVNIDIRFAYDSENPYEELKLETSEVMDAFAASLTVSILSYDKTNLLPNIADSNGNQKIDVQDLTCADLSNLNGIKASSEKNFAIQLDLCQSGSYSNLMQSFKIYIHFIPKS